MMKRTLWYACLVLLCCGIGGMVVLATSSGKTTLVPASGTSVSTAPVTGADFAASKVTNNVRVTKEENAVKQVEVDVPPPATVLPQSPEDLNAVSLETRAAGSTTDIPSPAQYLAPTMDVIEPAVKDAPEAKSEESMKPVVEDASDIQRLSLLDQAKALDLPMEEMESKSNTELFGLIAAAGTGAASTPSLSENPISEAEAMELAVTEIYERWENGAPVTLEDKALVSAFEDLHRSTPDAPRSDRTLDDNGGTYYVYSGDTLKVPPSGSGGSGSDTTRMNITVSGADAYILDVEIRIDSLRHTFDGDLDIFLRGPSGVVCTLSTDNGSTGDNMIRTLFDDEATGGSITGATAPMTGSYTPEYPLSIFDGLDPNGQWTLLIADDAGGDSGVIYSARLQIATANTTLLHNFTTTAITSPGSGTQAPASTVPVTAIFANLGTTTESATAKYQFNGGTVESEATDALAQFGRDTITFTNSITMPVTPGDYELVVWVEVAGDGDTSNDTLRRTIHVMWDGFACATAIEFTTDGPDSLTFNNTGAGNNTPGISCYTTLYNDMVFSLDVPNGYQGNIWQTSGTPDFYQSMRWNGDCPGTTVIDCRTTPDEIKTHFVNYTGSTQTIYYICGGTSSTPGSYKVAWHRQAAPAIVPPFASSFEITIAAPMVPNYYTLPDFWSRENVNGDLYQWENYNSGAASGTYCARMYQGAATGANDWLFTPPLQLNGGTNYFMEYWRKSYSSSYPESLEVRMGPQNNSSNMTTTLVALDSFRVTTWTRRTVSFTAPSSGTFFIGFHSQARRSGSGCYLDSISVVADTSCQAPTVTATGGSGLGTVTLTATASGGAGQPIQYQWFTGLDCQNGNQIAGATSSTYAATLTGTYSVRAWRSDSVNCAACDSAYALVQQCSDGVAPFFSEGFESVTTPNLPTCWTFEDFNAPSDDWVTTTSNPRTGTKAVYISYDASLPLDDWLYTRALNLTGGTTYYLDFWYRAGSSSYTEQLEVKYGTAATVSSMTNTLVPMFGFSNTTYQVSTSSFTPATTGQYYIGFHANSIANQLSIYMDDIAVYTAGYCQAPTVTLNSVTGSVYATLTATATGGFPGTSQYRWYTGVGCQDANIIAGATGASYITIASGIYSVKAFNGDSVTCAACDSAEATVTPDGCTAITTFPHAENFDGVTTPNLPTCWSKQDVNGVTSVWNSTTSNPLSSPNCVYITYNTTVGNDDWLFTPKYNLTGGQTYVLTYWRRSYSASYADSMEIKFGSYPVSTYMTNVITTPDSVKRSVYAEKSATFTPATTGDYYIGFHSLNKTSLYYTYIDDYSIYPQGGCQAPTVTVADCTNTESVRMYAVASGGYGGPIQYQWYTGATCEAGNEIAGATNPWYVTYSSGTFSCKAWRFDENTCSNCDGGTATVNPAPPGYGCSTAIQIFPVVGVTDSAAYNNSGMGNETPGQSCGTSTNDMVFFAEVPAYAKITMWQTFNDFDSRHSMRLVCDDPASTIGCIDDPDYTQYSYINCNSVADTVYFIVGYYSTSNISGNFRLAWLVENLGQCDEITCSPTVTESEPNGGCGTENAFNTIVCGDVVSGSVLATPTTRDVDAYEIMLTDCTNITVTVQAEFNVIVQMRWDTAATACPDVYFDSVDAAGACGTESKLFYNVKGGKAHILVYAPFTSPTCVARDYCMTVTCAAGSNPPGFDCNNAITISPVLGVADSATYNNYGMGTNNPGMSCVTTAYNDMVFKATVPVNSKLKMWQSSNTFDSYHTMRPICADTTGQVGCSATDELPLTYVNCGGSPQDVYFIVAGATSAAYGNLKLAWLLENNTCSAISCSPTVTESEPNDGCNASTFNTLPWGNSVVSGNVTATATTRDVDAYEIVLTDCTNISISVTAEFDVAVQMRWDTAATACPDVYKDSVNANPICSGETKTFYNLKAGVAHIVVYPPFQPTCTSRNYCLTVDCATGTLPPGDDCAMALPLTLPAPNDTVRLEGTTVGYLANYVDSCDFTSSAPDVIYSFTLTECRRMAFRLTGGDMHISLWEAGQCGTINAFLCNDDQTYFDTLAWENPALRGTGTISFCGGEIPAGSYYIRVSRYGSSTTGLYQLTVFDYGACPCEIVCDGGDALETTENRYDRTFFTSDPDGGCNSEPVVFGAANCGTTVCGAAWTYQRVGTSLQGNRDTDWYLFTITDRKIVSVTLNAEFPAWVAVMDTNGCVSETALFGDTAVVACTPTTISDTLDAGTYAMVVLPRYFVGNPLPSQYRATLVCNCMAGPAPVDVTVKSDSLDGTPSPAPINNYKNDVRLRWTADSSMAGTGTYKVYWNAAFNTFDPANPTSNGWAVLATGIVPVLGPHATTYDDLNVVNATNVKRYYIVVAECQ